MTRPGTLGELRTSGWVSRPVKEEVRANAIARIAEGEPLVDGVIGYEDTVLPQLENALLAGHDMIFLGERGQAKTRMIRSLTELLDEWMPIIAGSEINDDPYNPVSQHARAARRRARRRDADRVGAPRPALRREARHARHLDRRPHRRGRPDQGRRGPLPLRRAHHPLRARARAPTAASSRSTSCPTSPSASRSVCSTCSRSATCRSAATRSACRSTSCCWRRPTPRTTRTAAASSRRSRTASARRSARTTRSTPSSRRRSSSRRRTPLSTDGLNVHVPDFMTEIVAEMSQQARRSPHINQRSGVSVRLSIANYETLVANATRRALRHGETEVVPRVSDLDALVASTAGKVEFETVDDGREEQVLDRIVKTAVLETFRARDAPGEAHRARAGVRRRARRAHRRRHRVVGVREGARRHARAARRARAISTWARRPPVSRRRWSSCSKACTCRSV